VRLGEPEVVELTDGGVARVAQLTVDPDVVPADTFRCLTPGQVQHGLAPGPEVLALVPAAQRALKAMAVRVHESRELKCGRHAREDTPGVS
jgi:hypothetical protein